MNCGELERDQRIKVRAADRLTSAYVGMRMRTYARRKSAVCVCVYVYVCNTSVRRAKVTDTHPNGGDELTFDS